MNNGVGVIKVHKDCSFTLDFTNLTPSEQISVLCTCYIKKCKESNLSNKEIRSIITNTLKEIK